MKILLLLSLASTAAAIPAMSTLNEQRKWSTKIQVRLGDAPLSKYIDRSFPSYSIELAYWSEFVGGLNEPNEFTLKVLQNIIDRTGQAPLIRIGGASQDSSAFDETVQNVTRISDPSDGTIWKTVYGPGFYESLNVLPEGTKFILPLNLENNTYDIALAQAQSAWESVDHDKIWSFELGNEPSNFGPTGARNRSTWNEDAYTKQWTNWTSAIQSTLGLPSPSWLAGSDNTNGEGQAPPFLPEVIAPLMNADGRVREFSMHQYQYQSCTPDKAAEATVKNWIDHANITGWVDTLKVQQAAAHAVGSDLIVGEFNSVACSGRPNMTDSFAQALWLLDATLHAASINITRVHVHHGATLAKQGANQLNVVGADNTPGYSTYDLFYPRNSSLRGDQRTNPGYVGYLALGEAIGSSGLTKVQPLSVSGPAAELVGAYGIWDDGRGRSQLSRAVFINLAHVNVTSPPSFVEIDLSHLPHHGSHQATVKRMTAPGLDTLNSALVTWAGQSYKSGDACGALDVEKVKGGKVKVRGSEAVLVEFA